MNFQLSKATLAGAAAFILLISPPSAKADEPVALTPIAELPDRPDMDALAEELRALGPEERRERLSRLREKYGAREERPTPARRPAETHPHARLSRPFPDRAAYTNALAEARNLHARNIDPVVLMELQQHQLNARLRQYKSLGTNAPVELEAKIKQLEELNRQIDARLKTLKNPKSEGRSDVEVEESKEGNPPGWEAERSKGAGLTEEEKSGK